MQATDEQAEAILIFYQQYPGGMKESMKAALESLQIAPPTEEEIRHVYRATEGTMLGTKLIREALNNFANLRNNPTKPDPRRVAILKELKRTVPDGVDVVADRILKALDEVK